MKTIRTWVFLAVMASLLQPVPNAGAWGRFEGGHHPDHGGAWAHPNPVVVHKTYVEHRHEGCVGCGAGVAAVAGLVGGVLLGASLAGGGAEPPPEVVEAPPPTTIVVQSPPVGSEVVSLPPGCAGMNVNGVNYYQCGPVWYQPYFGGNGVYYTVVPTP